MITLNSFLDSYRAIKAKNASSQDFSTVTDYFTSKFNEISKMFGQMDKEALASFVSLSELKEYNDKDLVFSKDEKCTVYFFILYGDINFYDTANKFYMIQAKTFNQSKKINERYNDISSHSYFDYKYGFQNLTNLGNIENALFAYRDRLKMYSSRDFEDMSFMDNLKRIRVEESMWAALTNEGRREIAKSFSENGSKSFTSSWEQDVGWVE